MSAMDDFSALIDATDVMKQVMKTLREEPAHLLDLICREYRSSKRPVPDHRLHLSGYLSEAALRALISAGMVTRSSGRGLALYAYEPTAEGLAQCEKLSAGIGKTGSDSDDPTPSSAQDDAGG